MNLDQALNVGAYGVLLFVFMAVMKFLLTDFKESLGKIATLQNATNLVLGQLVNTIIMHDAQARGINVATGKNQAERDSLAVTEYRKLIAKIEDMNLKLAELGDSYARRNRF